MLFLFESTVTEQLISPVVQTRGSLSLAGFFHPRQRTELPQSCSKAVSLYEQDNTGNTKGCIQSREKCVTLRNINLSQSQSLSFLLYVLIFASDLHITAKNLAALSRIVKVRFVMWQQDILAVEK